MFRYFAGFILIALTPFAAAGQQSGSLIAGWLERPPQDQRQLLAYEIQGHAISSRESAAAGRFRLRTTCIRQGQRIATETIRWDDDKPILGWRSLLNGYFLAYESPPRGEAARTGFYAADGRNWIGDMFPTGLGTFDGYVPGDAQSLKQIASNAPRTLSSETLDGADCIKLDTEHPTWGHYTLWLDPEADLLPRKLVVEKRGHNLWSGRPLEDWMHLYSKDNVGHVRIESIELTIDHVQLDKPDGRWEARSWRATRRQTYSDHNWDETTMVGNRVHFETGGPESASDFTPALQEHAFLTNLTEPQLPDEWVHLQPQPWVDRTLVASMDATAARFKMELERPKAQNH